MSQGADNLICKATYHDGRIYHDDFPQPGTAGDLTDQAQYIGTTEDLLSRQNGVGYDKDG